MDDGAFDDRLSELQGDYECVIREMKSEKLRYDAIERALNTERADDDLCLN